MFQGKIYRQDKNAYQQNLAQPVQETPSIRGTAGRIMEISQSDPARGQKLQADFAQLQSTPGSMYYNPYTVPTNKAVGAIAGMGVDVSGGINSDWLARNAGLQEHYVVSGTTNNPGKPGKGATPVQQQAYQYWQVQAAQAATEKAQTEISALRGELGYWANRTDRNLSDDEIIGRVDWKRYPTLVQMKETAAAGAPMELNAPVDMATDDWMYGAIWAARNGGGTGDSVQDMAMSALGRGNVWQDNPVLRMRQDKSSDATYDPYSVSSTLDDACMYFGVSSFDRESIEEIRRNLDWDDETAVKYFRSIEQAEETTSKAEDELAGLRAKISEWISRGYPVSTIQRMIDRQYDSMPTVKALNGSVASRSVIGTTRPITGYRIGDIKHEAAVGREERQSFRQIASRFTSGLRGLIDRKQEEIDTEAAEAEAKAEAEAARQREIVRGAKSADRIAAQGDREGPQAPRQEEAAAETQAAEAQAAEAEAEEARAEEVRAAALENAARSREKAESLAKEAAAKEAAAQEAAAKVTEAEESGADEGTVSEARAAAEAAETEAAQAREEAGVAAAEAEEAERAAAEAEDAGSEAGRGFSISQRTAVHEAAAEGRLMPTITEPEEMKPSSPDQILSGYGPMQRQAVHEYAVGEENADLDATVSLSPAAEAEEAAAEAEEAPEAQEEAPAEAPEEAPAARKFTGERPETPGEPERVHPRVRTAEDTIEEEEERMLDEVAPVIDEDGTPEEQTVMAAGRTQRFEASAGAVAVAVASATKAALGRSVSDGLWAEASGVYPGAVRTSIEFEEKQAELKRWQEELRHAEQQVRSMTARSNLTGGVSEVEAGWLRELTGSDGWQQAMEQIRSDDVNERFMGYNYIYNFATAGGDDGHSMGFSPFWGSSENLLDIFSRQSGDNEERLASTLEETGLGRFADLAMNGGFDNTSETFERLTMAEEDELAAWQEDAENAQEKVDELTGWLEEHREAYESALDDIMTTEEDYACAMDLFGGEMVDDSPLRIIRAAMDASMHWTPVDYAPLNGWDAYVAAGNATAPQLYPAARRALESWGQAIDDYDMVLDIGGKYGFHLDDEQRRNLEQARMVAQMEFDNAYYFTLDGEEGFAEKAADAREKYTGGEGSAEGLSDVTQKNIAFLMGQGLDAVSAGAALSTATDYFGTDPFFRQFYRGSLLNPGENLLSRGQIALASGAVTEEERNRYFYLLSEYGEEEANKYFRHLVNEDYGELMIRSRQGVGNTLREWAAQNGGTALGGLAMSLPLNFIGSFQKIGGSIERRLLGGTNNPYGSTFFFSDLAGSLREGLHDNIRSVNATEEAQEATIVVMDALTSAMDSLLMAIAGNKAGAVVGKIASGIGDKFPIVGKALGLLNTAAESSGAAGRVIEFGKDAVVSWAHAVPMAWGAAESAWQRAIMNHATPDQAEQLANVTFLAESLTEAIEMHGIRKMFRVGLEGATQGLARMILSNGLNETVGEGFNQWWEDNAEKVIMGELSTYDRIVQANMERGLPRTMAEAIADKQMVKNITIAGISGFISAFGSSAGGYLRGAVQSAAVQNAAEDTQQRMFAAMQDANQAAVNGNISGTEAAVSISAAIRTTIGESVGKTVSAQLADTQQNAVFNTAAQHFVTDITEGSAPAALSSMKGIVAASGQNVIRAANAVVYGSLTEGTTNEVLKGIVAKAKSGTQITADDVARLTLAAQQDQNGPNAAAMQAQVLDAVKSNKVAAATVSILASEEGASARTQIVKAEAARDAAVKSVQAAQEHLASTQKLMQEKGQIAQEALQRMIEDPSDRNMKANMSAMAEQASAATQVAQAQEQLRGAQLALTNAETELGNTRSSALARVRETAIEQVETEEQTTNERIAEAAAQEAQQAAQEAEARQAAEEEENFARAQADEIIEENYRDASEEDKAKIREIVREIRDTDGRSSAQQLLERGAFAKRIAKKFGLQIRIGDTADSGKSFYHNARVNVTTGEIVLSPDATASDAVFALIIHEGMHIAEQSGEYEELANALLEMKYNGNTEQMQTDLNAKQALYERNLEAMRKQGQEVNPEEVTEDYARRELVADLMGELFMGENGQANTELLERLAAEKPGIARRILDAVRNFLRKMVGIKGAPLTQAQKIVDTLGTALKEAQQIRESAPEAAPGRRMLLPSESILRDQIRYHMSENNGPENGPVNNGPVDNGQEGNNGPENGPVPVTIPGQDAGSPDGIARPLEGMNPSTTRETGPGPQRAFGRGMLQQSDEIDQAAREYVLRNNNYSPDTNAAQIDRALQWIRENKSAPDSDGFLESLELISSPSFDYRSADGQARMVAAMGLAVAKGDVLAQRALADAFNRQGTDLGRTLQSRKLFRLMTPEGRISTLQKMLQDVNDSLNREGRNVNLRFSDWIYQAASVATEEGDFDQVRRAARQEIAEQVPANWRDRIRALRMFAMLANPRTHIRNVLGNAMFIPAVGMKNKIAALMELGVESGKRTKTLSPFLSREARTFAREDALAMKDTLRGEAKYNEETDVQRELKPFKGLLQAMIDFNGDMLEREDWVFLKGHYRRALGSWMMANGYTAEQLRNDQSLLEQGRAIAVAEAQKATYRDFSQLAATLNQVSRKRGVAGFITDAVLPFKKTPVNILKRGMEYSAAGIIRGITTDLYHLKQWNDFQAGRLQVLPDKAISPTQWIDRMSAGLSGTMIMALGAVLSSAGIVTGGLGDDEDKMEKVKGAQKYAIKFGIGGQDMTFTVDWAAPVSMPFFVGAAIQEMLGDEDGFSVDKMLNAFGNIAEPVTNLSMLDGVNSLLRTSQGDDSSTLTQIGAKIISNYVTSYVPSAVGAVARTIDPNRRMAFVESGKGGGVMGTARYAFEQTQNKIPGWGMTDNIFYRDVWGNPETTGFFERLAENFILPGYIAEYKDDPILNEMSRLLEETGDVKMVPEDPPKTVTYKGEKIVFSAEEWDEYKRARGQAAFDVLSTLIGSEDYLGADAATQAEMIKSAWSYADAVGRSAVIPGYPAPNKGEGDVGTIAAEAKETTFKAEMIKAMNAGDWETYGTMVEGLREAGVPDASIKTKIGNTFRDEWKAAFRAGDSARMTEIEEILELSGYEFNIYGSNGWAASVSKEQADQEK